MQQFGAPLQRHQQPTPEPQGSEVLLRVRAAGVCHTDLHTWHGWYDLGGGKRLSMGERGITLPLTLGHEIAGEVVALGPQAQGVERGQRMLVYPWLGCGRCKVCRRGQEQLCPTPRFLGIFRAGGYASHVLVPDAHGLIGAGGLGLMALSLLRALGRPGVVVVEPNAERRQAASDGGARAVVDCVGAAATVQLGLDLLVKGGQLILVGLVGGEISLSTPLVPIRAISIEGSYVGSLAELRELMALVQAGRVAPLPTTCYALHQAPLALQDLDAGRVVGRLVLQPEDA